MYIKYQFFKINWGIEELKEINTVFSLKGVRKKTNESIILLGEYEFGLQSFSLKKFD